MRMEEEKKQERPRRILIAGTKSGCGKSLVTSLLLRMLMEDGLTPAFLKCGPDYLDPLFHRSLSGVSTGNLDPYFMTPDMLRKVPSQAEAKGSPVVMEGVMGFYDGMGGSVSASTAETAELTDTPVILVVDCHGRAGSAVAEVYGFQNYHPFGARIRGVIFNRLSPRLYPGLSEEVKRLGLVPAGFLPKQEVFGFPSRYLGLVTPEGKDETQKKISEAVKAARETLDVSAVLSLAAGASKLETAKKKASERKAPESEPEEVRIVIAEDEAFCFYYEESRAALREIGCKLIPFSPIHDAELPECDGLILPGGYPELYAELLEKNVPLREQVAEAIQKGLPTLAECGGFLYLHRTLTDREGKTCEMVGALPGDCYYRGLHPHFGYVELRSDVDFLLGTAGERIRAHEFHYYESSLPGEALFLQKAAADPGGDEAKGDTSADIPVTDPEEEKRSRWKSGYASASLYAGFPHIPLYVNEGSPAKRFYEAARCFLERGGIR